MLALTRKEQQEIFIGQNIIVHIVSVSGNRVQLGIEAPADVPVYREELLQEQTKKEGVN